MSESEMVERVARAIDPDVWCETPKPMYVIDEAWDEHVAAIKFMREQSLTQARAAIKAMREPTREMTLRGTTPNGALHENAAILTWQRMNDAALGESKP